MKKSKKLFLLLLIVSACLMLLCNCEQSFADVPTKIQNDKTASVNNDPALPDRTLAFDYVEVDVPERITSAESVYVAYQDSDRIILSFGVHNNRVLGPAVDDEALAVITFDGETQYYPLQAGMNIISAVPHQQGIVYTACVEETSEGFIWRTVLTDGTRETVLDSGSVGYDYFNFPELFLLAETPYYMVKNGNGYSVKRIVEDKTEIAFFEEGCELLDTTASSNGDAFCYMIGYNDGTMANFVVANGQGVLHNCKVKGKLDSWGITEEYALCVSGDEKTDLHTVEMLNIATGEVTSFPKNCRALYQLRGVGETAICVDYAWKPVALDLKTQQIIEMELYVPSNVTPRRYYPMEDMKYLVHTYGQENAFYILTISEE